MHDLIICIDLAVTVISLSTNDLIKPTLCPEFMTTDLPLLIVLASLAPSGVQTPLGGLRDRSSLD